MPFADFYPFSSFLDAVEIRIREKAAEANGGSRPVVTQGQEHRRSMFEPAVVAFLTSLRDEGRLGATGSVGGRNVRSEEHTSELQSLMRISYAVFCLKKKKKQTPER